MKNNISFNPVLTTVAVEFLRDANEFVGRDLCPVFSSPVVSGEFPIWESENALNVPDNIERARGAAFSRSQSEVGEDSFHCRLRGHEEVVDDDERALYESHFDADASATRRAAEILMLKHEQRVFDLATGGSVATAAAATKWNLASPTLFADIDAAREVIHDNCGRDANLLVMGRDVYNVVKNLDEVLERIKYVQRGVTTLDILASLFDVDRVKVAGVVTNTAAEGQTMTPAKIWGDSVVLAHVNSAQDLKTPTFARTFSWTERSGSDGMQIESYREDDIQSDVHRAKQATQEKLVVAAAGYHISDCL